MEKVFATAKDKMNKTLANLDSEFSAIRAGRANPAVLDKISVEYYGVPTPINQLAGVSVTEARILTIQPWDKKALKDIEKAIQASDLGINPQNDGTVIRLTFPPLTEERRKQIVKDVKALAENARTAVRQIRRDCNDKLKAMKKNSEITEDDLTYGGTEIQKITDDFIAKVDKAAAEKEKEILEM